jgi:flavin reductase (DIM6/NTAB) family NADH-FMN oxidoreductase RutF
MKPATLKHKGKPAAKGHGKAAGPLRKSIGPPRKIVWKPGTMLNPVPVVMVTCAEKGQRPNIITIAWAGTVCSEPPMLSISIRPERYSHDIIKRTGEFVVNVPSVREIRAADTCGVVSGRDVDKFEKTGLTPAPASKVGPPIIQECPLALECRVRKTVELGTHTMFVAEIVAVQVSESLMTAGGRLALEKAGLAAFAHGGYYALGRKLGYYGFSVRKKRAIKKPRRPAA